MNKASRLKRNLIIAVIIICAAVIVWHLWVGGRGAGSKREAEETAKAPSQPSGQEGENVVTLDQATQAKSGILTSPLKQVAYQEEVKAYGTVLELQNIDNFHKNLLDSRKNVADLKNNRAAAMAEVEKTKTSVEASRKEYERLKVLYVDNRNISEKALQAEEVTWRSDEANARAAEQGLNSAQEALRTGEESLQILQDTIRQQWGTIIAGWIFEDLSALERLRQGLDVLIQITLPLGISVGSAPRSVLVQTGAGKIISANLVSPSPRTDPRIQGMSFFYLAPFKPEILLGMNVLAYLPTGPMLQGFFVPTSAIVWWQGKTWAYIQGAPDKFVRREIFTEFPLENGWFVRRGLSKGERIVTRGAELIFSQEFRSRIETE